jgi:hypothetical protein
VEALDAQSGLVRVLAEPAAVSEAPRVW